MSKYAFAAAAALSALIASSAAMAGSESAPAFTVSVDVLAGCTINTNGGDAIFTATAGTATTKPADVTTTASITCTNGTVYKVSLASTGGFKMKNGANEIAYSVVNDETVLSASGAFFSLTGNGNAQRSALTFSILPSAWNATNKAGAAGLTYSDTVTLNVAF